METSMRTVLFALAALLQAPAGWAVAPLPPPPPPPPPGALTPPRGPLLVQEPPPRVVFSNATGALLPCAATGNPPPTLRWQSASGAELSPVSVAGLRAALPGGWLQLPPFPGRLFRPEVHAAAYRCVASNVVGTVVSRAVTVRAVVLDQRYEAQVHDEFVIAGNTAVLRCHVPAFARDFVSVSGWLRGEPPRDLTPDVTTGGRFSVFPTGELHIRAATEEDARAGPYRCRTAHALSGHTAVSSTAGRLVVTEARGSVAPRLTDTRSHVTARARQAAELPCAAQAYPLPTYTWFRGGGESVSPVLLGDRVRQAGGSLFFRQVALADAGRYSCLANNSAGQQRALTTLVVTAPLSAHISPQQQTVSLGQPANLTCTTEGHPQLAVTWLKDGRPLKVSQRVQLLTDKILKISYVELEDRGMYQCIVSNNDDNAQGTAEINLREWPPVLVRTFSGATVRPGASWRATCEAAGWPRPHVSWLLDGEPLPLPEGDASAGAGSGGGGGSSAVAVSSVQVERARPRDAGQYECVAASAAGRASHRARLHVAGPPHVRPMADRRVAAGRTAHFTCRVAGFPVTQIRWERDGKSLPQNERQQVFANGTLVIKEAEEQDSGGYVCVASNPDGLTSRSKLNVQVLEPPEIHPFTVKPNLQRGMRIHLTCVVIRGDFPITFHWLKDGADLPQDSGVTEKTLDEYSSTLAISRLATRHSGNYTCTAANAVATASHTAEVVVSVPPSWKTEPQDASAVEGENLTIPCSASGTPTPKISWKRRAGDSLVSGTEEMHSSVNYGVLENGSLWIANVTAEHAGSYACEASTDASSSLSKTIQLTVHLPARLSPSAANVTVPAGGSATLLCAASGDAPVSVQWRRAGAAFDARRVARWSLSEQPLQAGLRSALTLAAARRDDSADFECRASNRYGSDLRRLRLVVQEPPDPPQALSVLAVSSRAANLTWQHPYDGNSPILEYIVQYKTGNASWQQAASQVATPSGRTWASVSGLLPGRRYEVRVLARNSLGLSKAPPTPAVALDTAQEPPGEPPTHLSVVPQDSQTLLVEWKAPDSELHGEVSGYRVEFWEAEAQQRQRRTLEAPASTPRLRLEGLRKAARYAVRVRAFNAAGDGPPGTEVLAATAEDVPEAAPLSVQCVATSPQSLLVEWAPPPEDKLNGRLLGYRLFYRPLTEWDDVSAPSELSTQEPRLEVSGLLRFCNYSLEVRAYTAAGDGVPSEPVFCRTWEDVPSPPDDIKALVMDTRTILLSWKPPAFPNGIIRKYKIYIRSLDGAALHRDEFEAPAGQTHYGLSHLAPLHRYELRVTAATAAGEGAPSRPVVQAPSDQVPARVASFGGVVHTARGARLSLPCLTVGRPRPTILWTHGERPVQPSQHVHVDDEWTLHIEGAQAQDAGNYSCRAENRLGSDSLLYTVTVHEVRNKDIPSTPEDFHVSSTTVSSITLAWRLPEGGKKLAAITDYCLHYKREFGEWEKIKIPGTESSFTLEGLQCGAKYLLYLQAEGRRGDSHPTDTIAARTQGAAPVAPPQSELVSVNATRVSLWVWAWRTGGCAISTLVVEYRRWDSAGWTLVSNSVPHADAPFSVLDLRPATRYLLRLTAHNSAGSTVALYDFVTLDDESGVVAPELIVQAGWRNGHFWRNPAIIVTLIAVLIAIIVAGVVLFSYLRRKRERFPAGRKESSAAEGEEAAGLGEKAGYAGIGGGGVGGGRHGVLSRHCRSHSDLQQQQQPHRRTQLALQPLHHAAAAAAAGDSATPSSAHLYATFRLAEERRLRWQQDELCDPRGQHQLDLQAEPPDWAPLRSLHLAHKY